MVIWGGKEETGPLRNSTIASKIEQGPGTGAGRDTKKGYKKDLGDTRALSGWLRKHGD